MQKNTPTSSTRKKMNNYEESAPPAPRTGALGTRGYMRQLRAYRMQIERIAIMEARERIYKNNPTTGNKPPEYCWAPIVTNRNNLPEIPADYEPKRLFEDICNSD